jgi:uncharacterized protein YbjT (DUF2867 family)
LRILIYGVTGMVGQGVLRECLAAADVEMVQAIGRTPLGLRDPKFRELVCQDLTDSSGIEAQLRNFDAGFFCLGVSSAGLSEQQYSRLTYELTLAIATTLATLNPQMTFVYVSGAGTDSTEQGRTMWARVKGRTENALRRLPFKAVYLFRPGLIQPLDGIESKTRSYRIIYRLARPLFPLLRIMLAGRMQTTAQIGQAMLQVARHGAPQAVLEIRDLSKLAHQASFSD